MAYQAWSHQPMVVEPEEATKRPSRVDKVTGDGHRHRRQSPYLVAKPLSDPFSIFVLNHYLPLPAVFRPSSLSIVTAMAFQTLTLNYSIDTFLIVVASLLWHRPPLKTTECQPHDRPVTQKITGSNNRSGRAACIAVCATPEPDFGCILFTILLHSPVYIPYITFNILSNISFELPLCLPAQASFPRLTPPSAMTQHPNHLFYIISEAEAFI